MENRDFAKKLAAARAGDRRAEEELVRQFEPYLRRVIRLRLHDSRLRRLLDSVDVCQSVLAVFFARAASGGFDVQSPEQLAGLLLRMALNRLATHARKNHRDGGALPDGWDSPDPSPSPARNVTARDLLQAVLARLSPEERALFEQNKVFDRPWAEIAAEEGGDPDALRMRLTRALARARRELQAEDSSHAS